VIKAWEGLGYYSRARRLHEGAKQIVQQFSGKIPSKKELLEKIKGLGPYTIHAILSFAFHQRAAAVDGNTSRVVSRHFLVEEDLARQSAKKKNQELADQMLDIRKPWVTAEALIELGATICQPKPLCDFCPLNASCLALKHRSVDEFPVKSKSAPLTALTRSVAVIEEGDCLLLCKGQPGKVMADLYEFPYFEGLAKPLPQHLRAEWGLETGFIRSLPVVKHSFTRYQAHLFPIHLRATQRMDIPGCEWVHRDQLKELPFSSGHRQILSYFLLRSDPQMVLFS
jgi:A/G-specific adenine glycosylase